jgi:hypothetical protein
MGDTDGVAKSAEWAADKCDISAANIAELARKICRHRTMLLASWSLSQQEHVKQPFCMLITLAAVSQWQNPNALTADRGTQGPVAHS